MELVALFQSRYICRLKYLAKESLDQMNITVCFGVQTISYNALGVADISLRKPGT